MKLFTILKQFFSNTKDLLLIVFISTTAGLAVYSSFLTYKCEPIAQNQSDLTFNSSTSSIPTTTTSNGTIDEIPPLPSDWQQLESAYHQADHCIEKTINSQTSKFKDELEWKREMIKETRECLLKEMVPPNKQLQDFARIWPHLSAQEQYKLNALIAQTNPEFTKYIGRVEQLTKELELAMAKYEECNKINTTLKKSNKAIVSNWLKP